MTVFTELTVLSTLVVGLLLVLSLPYVFPLFMILVHFIFKDIVQKNKG